MKNLLVCCFVLLSINGFCQGFMKGLAQRLSFGLKAGGNYSNYTNSDGQFTSDGLASFHAGALVDFRITKNKTTYSQFAKQLDMGVAGGIGYLSKMGLGIGVRYIGGMTKVADFNINNAQPNFRNSMAQASVFYIF